jgi:hypothetical protein
MKKTNSMNKVGLYRRFSSVLMIIIMVLISTLSLLPVLFDEAIPNAQGKIVDNIFFDDMEAGGPADSGQWTVLDSVFLFPPQPSASTWEHGVPAPPPSAFSPTNVWATELSGPYQSPSESILVTPPIDLSYIDPEAMLSVKLTFWHFYNFAPFDGGWVEVNPIQYNPSPEPLEPEEGYPGMVRNTLGMMIPAYSESNDRWEKASFDLSDYIGEKITLGFHFSGYYTDGFSARGWYVDDVLIDVTRLDGPLIGPDQTGAGFAGDTVSYTLTITNYNSEADYIDIFFSDDLDWPVDILNASTYLPLANAGGDPRFPDVYLLPNASIDIVVNITIPSGITEWDLSDITTVFAQSGSNPSKWDSAELITKTPYPDVGIIDITMPTIESVGTPIVVDITVENLGDWTVSLDVLGELSAPLFYPPTLNPSPIQTIIDLGPGENTNIQWTFTPTIRGDYKFSATTLLDIDQVESNNHTMANVTVVDFLWTDDMEVGGDAQDGLWEHFVDSTAVTDWELGIPTWFRGPSNVPSPANCWGTDLDFAYVEDTDCYLFTPQTRAFDFSGYEEIKLAYSHWMKLQAEPTGDVAQLVYTYDADPIVVSGIMGPVATYTDKTIGWREEEYDFTILSGQPYVRFGWRLFENIGGNKFESGQWPGWYVDDVIVWANYPMPEVIITEIDDSSGDEHIEVYNKGSLPVILSDYEFTMDLGMTWLTSGTWSTPILSPGATAYYSIPAGLDELNDQGESITLVNTTSIQGVISDSAFYGQKGTIPDPIPTESVGRHWDGIRYVDEWSRENVPTIGSLNNNPGEVNKKYVVLNEVFYNPTLPQDGFIEIMYVGSSVDPDVNVLNWILVVGDSVIPIPSGAYSTVLNPSNPFYVIDATMVPGLFGTIDVNGDNVYLHTDFGDFVDEVGWNLPHLPDTSVSRVPDGFGVALNGKDFGLMGYDDSSSIAAGWVFERIPTIPYILAGPDQVGRNFPGEYVRFNLTVENKQLTGELIEIFNTSSNGWFIDIYDATNIIKLTDSDGDGTCDIWLSALGSINITVRVYIPEMFPIPDKDDISIYIQSDSNVLIGDFTYLEVVVYPYLEPIKSINPSSIYLEGSGVGEQAKITLKVKGSGIAIPGIISNMADIVFVVDDTGSMGDDIEQVKEDIDYITDRILENITSVRFGLISYKDQPDIEYDVPLTFDVDEFKNGVMNLEAMGGGDYEEAVKDALIMGRDNSDWRDTPVVRIMILIGDADPHDPAGAVDVADDAYTNHDIITCVMDANPMGLQSFVDIADAGHGIYEHVGNSEEMADAIINAILFLVPPIDLAGEDIDQTDSDFMIQDVLPEYIHYVPGSFSIPPEAIYIDIQNRTVLQWNVSRIRIGQIWRVSFSITSSMIGLVDSNDYFTSRVNYSRWDNSTKTSLFPMTKVLVKLGEPQPPELFIDVVDDVGNLDGRGKNIRLSWIHSNSRFIDHYLVYRSENQNDFDFSNPWVRTDTDSDNGIDPLRNSWNDTLSAEPGKSNYNKEWYYVIRAVDIEGKISHTSRTVGKWTKNFPQGTSTFSLPLEPFITMDTDYYTTDMDADYIKWMDPVTHIWNIHNFGDGSLNSTDMIVGEVYEVHFSASADYTFTGLPGAMIKYDNTAFSGFNWNSDAKSLTASVEELSGDVTLSWARPSGMSVGADYYYVYYSGTRDGFWGILGIDYNVLGSGAILTGTETAIHFGAAQAGTQFYYMIVPVRANDLQIGASTYSIGVWTEEYLPQYDSFGIPLKMDDTYTADWYCENIPDAVGMNYHIYSGQRWGWHSTRMPSGAYDPDIIMADGYQISTINTTKYTFIGI